MTGAILLALTFVQSASASTDSIAAAIAYEAAVERLADDEDAAAALSETLLDAARWRLDVNTASAEALRGLPGLTEPDVQRLLSHRRRRGALTDRSDLQEAGLSDATVAALMPLIDFRQAGRRASRTVGWDLVQRWGRRLDVGRGYGCTSGCEAAYAGTPDALQTRLRLHFGPRLSAGATIDSDAGEQMDWSRGPLGADFASAHVMVDAVGPLERVIGGAFSVNAGEGLVLGQGRAGMAALRLASGDRLLRPHTSAREYAFFRGLALHSTPLRGIAVAAFLSSNRLDGRPDSLPGTWLLASPGAHRTGTERSGRRRVRAQSAGAVVRIESGGLHLGAAWVMTRLYLQAAPSELRSATVFGGWIGPQGGVTAEIARDAAALTASFVPDRDAYLHARVRWIGSARMRPHSGLDVNARGEGVPTLEWEAAYGVRPWIRWTLDVRTRSRRRQANGLAIRVRRADIDLTYLPVSWLTVSMRATLRAEESAAACLSGLHLLPCTDHARRHSARLQFEYRHSRRLRSRSRIETVAARQDDPSAGVLLFQDLRWSIGRRIQIDARYALFEATDSAARLYVVEQDVLYAFSAPSLSGRGRRWYVMFRVAASDRLNVQARFAATFFEDVTSVGSGLDQVPGHRLRDIRLQMRWRIGA